MFGFLTSGAKDITDPLVSAKSVAGWLRQLPALDVIGRQQHVMRAFDAMRQSRKPIDVARVQAVELLDAALGADRRQLIKQYVENYDGNPKLAEAVCRHLNISLGRAVVGRFSNGEVMVELLENVRGRDVFILQSTCVPTNDNLMEILVMTDALKRASAGRITAAIPYFGYARQDRRPRSARVPISA